MPQNQYHSIEGNNCSFHAGDIYHYINTNSPLGLINPSVYLPTVNTQEWLARWKNLISLIETCFRPASLLYGIWSITDSGKLWHWALKVHRYQVQSQDVARASINSNVSHSFDLGPSPNIPGAFVLHYYVDHSQLVQDAIDQSTKDHLEMSLKFRFLVVFCLFTIFVQAAICCSAAWGHVERSNDSGKSNVPLEDAQSHNTNQTSYHQSSGTLEQAQGASMYQDLEHGAAEVIDHDCFTLIRTFGKDSSGIVFLVLPILAMQGFPLAWLFLKAGWVGVHILAIVATDNLHRSYGIHMLPTWSCISFLQNYASLLARGRGMSHMAICYLMACLLSIDVVFIRKARPHEPLTNEEGLVDFCTKVCRATTHLCGLLFIVDSLRYQLVDSCWQPWLRIDDLEVLPYSAPFALILLMFWTQGTLVKLSLGLKRCDKQQFLCSMKVQRHDPFAWLSRTSRIPRLSTVRVTRCVGGPQGRIRKVLLLFRKRSSEMDNYDLVEVVAS